MKQIITCITTMLCLAGCTNNTQLVQPTSLSNAIRPAVPVSLLTQPNQRWKISTTEESRDKLISARFEADGNYTFMYSNKSEPATATSITLQIQGKAAFSKTGYGKNIFLLHPVQGIKTEGGKAIVMGEDELKTNYSTTYLWEKISFKDMPAQDFLLLVDMDAHPLAGTAKPGTIDKTWVSKFYAGE